jgi:hypothetical protein
MKKKIVIALLVIAMVLITSVVFASGIFAIKITRVQNQDLNYETFWIYPTPSENEVLMWSYGCNPQPSFDMAVVRTWKNPYGYIAVGCWQQRAPRNTPTPAPTMPPWDPGYPAP